MSLVKSQYVNLYAHIHLSSFALTYDVGITHKISILGAN